jgi:mRNA-degrading endonuclease RelE of RelBE toxin-antitoxin system
MSFKVRSIRPFDRQLRRLARKFPSLTKEYEALLDTLEVQPQSGKGIGQNCYKIRLTIASKGGGKSGGARVITYVRVVAETVYLLAIYDKSEQITLTDQQVLALLTQLDE